MNIDTTSSSHNATFKISKDKIKLEPLTCKHVLEVQDPKHRYGSLLQAYETFWKTTNSNLTFFDWLDSSESKDVDLQSSFSEIENSQPREEMEKAIVKYLNEEEREPYRVVYKNDGECFKLVWASHKALLNGVACGDPVHTNNHELFGDKEPKWIFVISTDGVMYVGEKVKRRFHHSSFVAGEPVLCAGRVVVDHGKVRMLMPYSGHYLTSLEVLEKASELFFGLKMAVGDPEEVLKKK